MIGRNQPRPRLPTSIALGRGRRAARWGCFVPPLALAPSLQTRPCRTRGDERQNRFSHREEESWLRLIACLPQQIPVVFSEAGPCHAVRNAGQSLLVTHPSRELATELERDRMVVTANRLMQNFPEPPYRSDVFLHLLCLCHVPLTPKELGPSCALLGFSVEGCARNGKCGDGITARKMTRRCRGGSRLLCHSQNVVNSTSCCFKRRPRSSQE